MNTKKIYISPNLICVEMEAESPIAVSIVPKGGFSTAPTSALQMLD
ncbi:MAG: hypothetical protein MJ009_07070 [Paludibacteraceae bacterium]|nr:hypothetical protein [Paludibacteraceae bacterium]